MRITRLHLTDYKGLDVDLEWSPLTVLFGPNDSGKTNLIEAITRGFRAIRRLPTEGRLQHEREDRFHPNPALKLRAQIELDGVGVSRHPDDLFLAQWLQFGIVWLDPDRGFVDTQGGELWQDPELRPGAQRWSVDDYNFRLDEEPLPAAAVLAELRAHLLEGWSRLLADDWSAAAPSVEQLLDACLGSRRFSWHSTTGAFHPNFAWVFPAGVATPEVVEAAKVVRRYASRFPAGALPSAGIAGTGVGFTLANVVNELADERLEGTPVFLSWTAPQRLNLWDVVQIADTKDALDELAARVRTFVDRHVAAPWNIAPDEPFDPWLEPGRSGWYRINPDVRTICERLTHEATQLAPAFVRDRYDIAVDTAPPPEWGVQQSRVSISLATGHSDDERFELHAAGSGVAVWASYALIEAMRRLDEALNRERRAEAVRLAEEYEATPDEEFGEALDRGEYSEAAQELRYKWIVGRWPLIPEQHRQTIYIFDEPERHLHPLAQQQVAEWIAWQVASASSAAVIATHAPPFLDLPPREAEYVWVSRGSDGLTRVSRLTEDLLGLLAEHAHEIGLPPAQAAQLTRAWFVVEGAHDEMVLRRFYDSDLRRERVSVLALRGVNEALALLQLGHLATFQVPLIVLFDNVRSSWLEGAEPLRDRPSREEKMIDQLRRLHADPNVDLRPIPFTHPDVIRALPEDAIKATLDECYRGRSARFPGWDALDDAYDEAGQPSDFKKFLMKTLELGSVDVTSFLQEVLRRSDDDALVGTPLHRAVQRALATLS